MTMGCFTNFSDFCAHQNLITQSPARNRVHADGLNY
jgi:hypothetical protein